ncbi:RNA polymerase factor sigma-54 [Sabulicella rubraurantiaca]|uniref:RNA polymerase factor sigma-54 n=1 Tax=Sabulicella rubraurantiaca TaxID=2811429 RepID=UPI001A9704F2|nr:RNA polymerase factor sigma-54 [Sabulicella rubraurantiaca]
MSLGPRLDLRQSQSLVMTPQLRQAIKLLHASNLEVAAFVEEELERNPLLERDEGSVSVAPEAPVPDAAEAATSDRIAEVPLDADLSNVQEDGDSWQPALGPGGRSDFGDGPDTLDGAAAATVSLRERLAEQIRLSFPEGRERMVAAALLALLDPSGRFLADPAQVAGALGCEQALVEAVRGRLMRFEPVGIFARDLRECLEVQLIERGRFDPFMARLLDNLPLLAQRDMRGLQAACGVDAEDLAEMVAELRRLDPKPGAGADDALARPVQADILMRPDNDGGWVLELNLETLPRVLVNRGFAARATVSCKDREGRNFLQEQLQSANWLVKSLEQRSNTILRVASEIVRRQDAFLRHGIEFLRPLILRDVADAVELHESTVSRVTSNKYIQTPRGLLELKFFFTTALSGASGAEAVSAESVRHRIKSLVHEETAESVLSDDAIVAKLREEGVDIARRTVAKYREALRIPSSVERRRQKAAG